MIVTFSGVPCSGKSTIADKVSERLGWKRKSLGDLMKRMAAERGMNMNDFYDQLGDDPELEKSMDMRQKRWGDNEDNFIIDGRISFYFMPKEKSYNIFFDLPLEIAAERSYKRGEEGKGERFRSVEKAKESIAYRIENERKHYRELYGINHLDKSNYDLVVDADKDPETILEEVYAKIDEERKRRGEY